VATMPSSFISVARAITSSSCGQTQVGRNFKQYGLLKKLLPVKMLQVCEYFLQRIALLQFAQARRVGRAYIHHKKIHIRMQGGKAGFVILPGVFVRCGFVLANVAADKQFGVCRWCVCILFVLPTLLRFSRHCFSRAATASTPSLLKPMRLIRALSFGRRNRRGLSLPAWAFGVTVPISTKPKPKVSSSRRYNRIFIKPAPRPTGFLKWSPNCCTGTCFGANSRARLFEKRHRAQTF
jgi:hypothetical protein